MSKTTDEKRLWAVSKELQAMQVKLMTLKNLPYMPHEIWKKLDKTAYSLMEANDSLRERLGVKR